MDNNVEDEYFNDPYYKEYYLNEVQNSKLEDIADANNLNNAYYSCKKEVGWKNEVQNYGFLELFNIRKSQKEIRNGTYKQKPMNEFQINERGHVRDVKALRFSDRVVQKSLNDNVLLDAVKNKLIYDNGASLKGKGLGFSRQRFEIHLRNAYKEYNDNCWILFMDFSNFFDNICHDIILNYFSELLSPEMLQFVANCFKEFEIDVSYMNSEEFNNYKYILFNSLDYAHINKNLLTNEKIMCKSVGIGSQLSQITGIFFPHKIDNYCKTILGLKYYGRYMDDSYIIFNNDNQLKSILYKIDNICKDLGIFINWKKTRIQRVDTQSILSFLKINYKVTPTYGLIRKVNSETFRRERRRLKKFYDLYINGRMSKNDIINCYKSWRGTYSKFDSGYEIYKMDKYFIDLFNTFI